MLGQRRTREPGMPPASRLRPGSRSTLLGVVAGVLLVLALVVTGRVLRGPDLPSSTRPLPTAPAPVPYRVGDRLACPHIRPVLATSDGRSYPLGHPGRPARSADPVACYATVAEATAAGYPEAPLPAGALELGGVYLVPVPETVPRDCRRAAGRLGLAVPCPRLRPTPSLGAPPPAVCPRPCGPGFGFLFQDTGFRVPSGYVGAYPEVGHRLVVAAARRPEAAAVACPGERPVGQARIRGRAGGLFACPPGTSPHDEGLLLRWREGGAVLALSVTGDPAEVGRLVLALAAHLDLVPPARRTPDPGGRQPPSRPAARR
jgi:hypothetical protein